MKTDTPAESHGKSLATLPGSSRRPLVPDAVRLVTKIEQDFSKEAQTHLVVLIELFRGVLKNCRSGDAISLAIYAAEDKLQGAVDPVIIRASALWWLRMLDRPQPTDPMYETFDEARHAP